LVKVWCGRFRLRAPVWLSGRVRVVPIVLTAVVLAGLGGLSGCGSGGGSGKSDGAAASGRTAASPPAGSPIGDPAARAAAAVAAFTDVELVGQVLMPYAYGNDATKVTGGSSSANNQYAGVSTPAEMVTKYKLGGLILVGWTADDPTAGTNKTTNVDSPEQIRQLTAGLHDAARRNPGGAPLLIGTDQEYGAVTRIKSGVIQLPSAMAFGAARNPAATEAAWKAAAGNLAALGINVDFAPVADVLGPRGSGVIGSRSYGSDPAAVSEQVAAAVRGLAAAGVAPALKHFPGHGHTTADSHEELPVLAQDAAALDRDDLPPFVAGIKAGAGIVMGGHLDVKALDPGVTATFSSKVLIDLLRVKLGFTGVVVTDAMNMTPAKRYGPGEAAVKAVLAGNDLVLMPPNLKQAQKGMLDALKNGSLPRPRLIEAATRVLTLRYRLAGTAQPEMSTLNSPADQAAVQSAAAAAVTVFRGRCTGPLVNGGVTITGDGKWAQQRDWLAAALAQHGVPVRSGGTSVRLLGYGDGGGGGGADVTVAMDAPYVLRQARGTLVATYSSSQASMVALAAVLAGKATAPGRSPVTVEGLPPSACAR
jgi:beta-N-acetylhexosaminidase